MTAGARRAERIQDAEEALIRAFAGLQAGIWTALPATVVKVDLEKMTIEAQPTIAAQIRAPDGSFSWVTMPVMVDVPIIFPSGGGYTLTFPIAVGDECLLVYSSRCIDAWWQSGGVQLQADLRMHDLSDAFALIGPRSQPRVLPSVSTTSVELRNDAGTTRVAIKANGDLAFTTPGTLDISAGTVNITAAVHTTGALTNNGKDVGSAHKHSGVQPGGSNTGNPV